MAAQVEAARPAGSAVTVLKSQRKPGDTDRVVISLEAGGDTNYTADGKPQHEKMGVRVPISTTWKRRWNSPPPRMASGVRVRDYRKVEAVVKHRRRPISAGARAATSPDRRRSRQAVGPALLARRKSQPR